MSAHLPDRISTADERGELFGVHIPELQLPLGEYRAAFRAAALQPDERYVELGSGHGHGLVLAAGEFGARALGIEYLEDAIATSRQRAADAGVADRVEVVRADLRRVDLRDADVVHLHLGPAFHDLLASRLEQALSPGARVVCAGWEVPGWRADPAAESTWPGGSVYRPADPAWHVSLASCGRDRDSGAVVAWLDVHADLADVTVTATTSDGSSLPVLLREQRLWRGQRVAVAIDDGGGSGGSVSTVRLELVADARDGRRCARGPGWQLAPEQRD